MAEYTISRAVDQDNEDIIGFINAHFVPFEPINAAINLCEKGYRFENTMFPRRNVRLCAHLPSCKQKFLSGTPFTENRQLSISFKI